jgi:diketogulonate reductase-like aldo/keto reductase
VLFPQVCLRWVLQRGAVMAVGTGSNPATAGQYSAEDLDLFSFNLTAPEMSTLNALK